jgi:hypothetical protein
MRDKVWDGLDAIDWGSMHHAYGPASDVPDLLRGLLSEDADEREAAIDDLNIGVHHQGDIYDCTIACIPFLLAALADPEVLDRHEILDLVGSVGGADLAGDDSYAWINDVDDGGDGKDERESKKEYDDDDAELQEYRRLQRKNSRIAHRLVLVGFPVLIGLLDDADVRVRRQAVLALRACWEMTPAILLALRRRLAVEPDSETRLTALKVACTIARWSHPQASDLVKSWFAGLAALAADDPALRLGTLAQLGLTAPDALPPDIVRQVLAAMDEAYDSREFAKDPDPAQLWFKFPPVVEPPPPRTAPTVAVEPTASKPSRLAAIREISERERKGKRLPWMRDVLWDLHTALGDRIAERLELLTAPLQAPEWERRIDAVREASSLVRGWRADYRDLIALIGDQLADIEQNLRADAADLLMEAHGLAAPATDALARCVVASPRQAPYSPDRPTPFAWVITWDSDEPRIGAPLKALAQLGDGRALPALRWLLECNDMPWDTGAAIGHLGTAATELVPIICQRLITGPDRGRAGLVGALGDIGPAAAPAIPTLLDLLSRGGRESLLGSIIGAIGRLGVDAAEAVPAMRGLLAGANANIALSAASALWRIERHPDLVLPVFSRHLASDDVHVAMAAARGLTELSRVGAPTAPILRRSLSHANALMRLHAAAALWRVVGDVDAALPVLCAVWKETAHVRREAARTMGEMGLMAASAVPLLDRELATVRRHNADRYGGHSIHDDEELLRACSEARAAIAGVPP